MNASHFVAAAVIAILTLAVRSDLRRREIPDVLPLALLGLGIAAAIWSWHPVTVGQAAAGFGLAFGIGAALFYAGAMGGGDAKLGAGLGAVCGWPGILETLFGTALVGGLVCIRARRRGDDSVPFAPAFAGGYLVTMIIVWSTRSETQGLWHLITGRALMTEATL